MEEATTSLQTAYDIKKRATPFTKGVALLGGGGEKVDVESLVMAVADDPDDETARMVLRDLLLDLGREKDAKILEGWPLHLDDLLPNTRIDIHTRGTVVFQPLVIDRFKLERWTILVHVLSGQDVDWGYNHTVGSQAVMMLGKQNKVKSAIIKLMPLLGRFYNESLQRIDNTISKRYPEQKVGKFIRSKTC